MSSRSDQVRDSEARRRRPWSIPITPMDRVSERLPRPRRERPRARAWNHHLLSARRGPGPRRRLKKHLDHDRQLEPSARGLRGRCHRIPYRRERLSCPDPWRSPRDADAGAGFARALHLASTGPGRQRRPQSRLRPRLSGRPGGNRGSPGHAGRICAQFRRPPALRHHSPSWHSKHPPPQPHARDSHRHTHSRHGHLHAH